ncbi:MAG: poly-beta-1,6-N-acetyl-D-glucosamine N-deacetylase PgaB [Luteimonas sp.]
MRHMLRVLALALALFAMPAQALVVISYHDIRDDVRVEGDADQFATSTQNFAAHLDWLHGHGYRPVSLQQVVDASHGGPPLPDKAVLLTFDDGLRSAYDKVYPLLRAYRYPALLAVVTDWIDLPSEKQIDYGHRMFGREDFLTWQQLREMQASGLVEIASHSHDLHTGVLANPQGNRTPSAVTRIYDPVAGRYEDEGAYTRRIRSDLTTSRDMLARQLGRAPRALVWPYAAYNSVGNRIADGLGYTITFDLEGLREQKVGEDLHGLARLLLQENPNHLQLAYEMRRDIALEPVRGLQVDLDYLYDADAAQVERNLDKLIERVKQIKPSHVFLQAFADPDGNGSADALYFPNRQLPMRADLFSRVAWQLRTRSGVKVFAWLPVLGFELPGAALVRGDAAGEGDIHRVDPGDAPSMQRVAEIYEDLAVNSYFEGVLFHDDAYLRDDEPADAPPSTPAQRTDVLIDTTLRLRDAAQRWRPKLVTVRNLYARPVLEPASEAWFGQRLDAFLERYDYVALMAMPWMEGSKHPEAWLDNLVATVAQQPEGLKRTIFELQTVDWQTKQPIPPDRLKAIVRQLQAKGARHLAWYPDDFISDQPPLDDAREAMSARAFPYLEP